MKKSIMFALLGLLLILGPTVAFAQGEDSTEVAIEEPQDTISIDSLDPEGYYTDETTEKSSGMMTYAIIGGVLIVGAGAYMVIRKKKK